MQSSFKVLILCLGLALIAAGCNRGTTSQTQAGTKHYRLKGKVVSIDKRANMANIDGEDIPGFMGAMTMPYVVKPASELDKLTPGDAITADVVVEGDNSWLENIAVTGHSTAPAK